MESPPALPSGAELLALREQEQPTLPSTIALERATNLFVRAESPEVLRHLRGHKDLWKG